MDKEIVTCECGWKLPKDMRLKIKNNGTTKINIYVENSFTCPDCNKLYSNKSGLNDSTIKR